MRARNLVPQFFDDDRLAGCSGDAWILFVGLHSYMDREGKCEFRPLKIKARIFTYRNNVDIEALTDELIKASLIVKYPFREAFLLFSPDFLLWQRPHKNETLSNLPYPDQGFWQPCPQTFNPNSKTFPYFYENYSRFFEGYLKVYTTEVQPHLDSENAKPSINNEGFSVANHSTTMDEPLLPVSLISECLISEYLKGGKPSNLHEIVVPLKNGRIHTLRKDYIEQLQEKFSSLNVKKELEYYSKQRWDNEKYRPKTNQTVKNSVIQFLRIRAENPKKGTHCPTSCKTASNAENALSGGKLQELLTIPIFQNIDTVTGEVTEESLISAGFSFEERSKILSKIAASA